MATILAMTPSRRRPLAAPLPPPARPRTVDDARLGELVEIGGVVMRCVAGDRESTVLIPVCADRRH